MKSPQTATRDFLTEEDLQRLETKANLGILEADDAADLLKALRKERDECAKRMGECFVIGQRLEVFKAFEKIIGARLTEDEKAEQEELNMRLVLLFGSGKQFEQATKRAREQLAIKGEETS